MANDYDGLSPGQVLLDASVADFVSALGLSIAEAQRALDINSVEQLDAFISPVEGLGGRTLLEMGLQPAFYHFQHADVSCSLQLSLQVEKNFGIDFGINGNFNSGQTSQDNRNDFESESESGTRSDSRTRRAEVEIKATTVGILTINGRNHQLDGTNPVERIENLADQIRGDEAIDLPLFEEENTPVNPTTTADEEKVQVGPNSVTFLSNGYNSGYIRITARPGAAVDYKLNDDVTINVPRTGSKRDHAIAVTKAINDHPQFRAFLIGHPGMLRDGAIDGTWPAPSIANFLHDDALVRAQVTDEDGTVYHNYSRLASVARFLKAVNEPAVLVGATDRSGGAPYNIDLSRRRAEAVEAYLVQQQVGGTQMTTQHFGESLWSNTPDGARNGMHRAVLLQLDSDDYYIGVRASEGTTLENIEPDKRGEANGSGWVYLDEPADLEGLTGVVSINGTDFPLTGAAAGSHAANSPEAFAANLAGAVNGDGDVGVKASPRGNVVSLQNQGDKFKLTLLTTRQEDISVTTTRDLTVTEQFSRTRTRRETSQRNGNKTIAVGASLDLSYSRRFDMTVTGNSSVSARLVSVPAPPEFLETMREFLQDDQED